MNAGIVCTALLGLLLFALGLHVSLLRQRTRRSREPFRKLGPSG